MSRVQPYRPPYSPFRSTWRLVHSLFRGGFAIVSSRGLDAFRRYARRAMALQNVFFHWAWRRLAGNRYRLYALPN